MAAMGRGMICKGVLAAAFILIATTSAGAAQFEEYEWGDSREVVLQKLRKEKPDTRVRESGWEWLRSLRYRTHDLHIYYDDDIFHERCTVTLYVNKNHGLYRLFVKWDFSIPASLPEKVVEALSSKYGEPKHDKPSLVDRYLWGSSGNNGQRIDVKLLSLPAGDSDTSPYGYVELEYVDVERSEKSITESTADWEKQRSLKETKDSSRF